MTTAMVMSNGTRIQPADMPSPQIMRLLDAAYFTSPRLRRKRGEMSLRGSPAWARVAPALPTLTKLFVSSPPLEARRPLLAERRDAFGKVAARARLALQVALDVELGGEVVVRARAYRLLDEAVGAARAAGKPPRQRRDLAGERRVVEHAVDEAHAVEVLGRHLVGGEHERERKLRPDDARQEPGAAGIGHQRDAGERFLQIGRARRDDEVAGERDIGGGTDRRAVERRDRHLGIGV